MHRRRCAAESKVSPVSSRQKDLFADASFASIAALSISSVGTAALARSASVSINHLVKGSLTSVEVKLLIIPRRRKTKCKTCSFWML